MPSPYYFNITGASSAAAELTRELIAPGENASVSNILLTNVHADTKCTVDLYIEKSLEGKFYLLEFLKDFYGFFDMEIWIWFK